MRITLEQDPKYGAKRMGTWLLSSLEQVNLATARIKVFSSTTVSGTGGTVAGVGQYLKSMNQDVFVAIADPEGSGLYNKVMLHLLISKFTTNDKVR